MFVITVILKKDQVFNLFGFVCLDNMVYLVICYIFNP